MTASCTRLIRRICPTCNGTGTMKCLVVVEAQLGDEVPYDSTIGRFHGADIDDTRGLKKNQRVEHGCWDCEDCVDGWVVTDMVELTEVSA